MSTSNSGNGPNLVAALAAYEARTRTGTAACSCDAGGEHIACPTHGAKATIRELQAENTRLGAKVDRLSADVNRLTTKGVEVVAENTRLREALLDIGETVRSLVRGALLGGLEHTKEETG